MDTFAARLRQLRKDKNSLTFAKELGISTGSLNNYEQGKSTPSARVLIQISERTGVSLSWLASGADDGKMSDKSDILEDGKKQHPEITNSQKNKMSDSTNFSEMMELNRELRQSLRENADLRVERERWVAERVRLHHDNEMLRHDNEVLRHELGVYRGTEKSAEYPVQRGAPRTSPPPPDESREIDAPCTCGTASPLQDPPTNHPRK